MVSIDANVNTPNNDENSKMMGQYFTPRQNVEESFGKNTEDYRKWLSENVNIIKIIKMPSNLFTNTQPKTICFYLEGDNLISKLL